MLAARPSPPDPFSRGERVLFLQTNLEEEDGEAERFTRVVVLDGEVRKVAGLGVVDLKRFEGMREGDPAEVGTKRFVLLRPSAIDHVEALRRKAQIIQPKDSALILLYAGIGPGSRVAEAGIGSAALTVALASAVGDEGKVFVHEVREDFLQWGRENLEHAGLAGRCAFTLGDVVETLRERDLDAVCLDMPDPWRAVPVARAALRPSGTLVTYTPLVSQLERTVRTMQEAAFLDVRSFELLQRGMVVGEMGTRPAHKLMGHTGYLTFARKGRSG